MAQLFETDQIPHRYGLDELPADITKRELLYYFSIGSEERSFIMERGRFPSYRIVLGIQLGSHRFIGRPQPQPENTPAMIIKFVARALKFRGNFVPLKYSDREKTCQEHTQATRQFLGLFPFLSEHHQLLSDHLIQKSPDPGHLPDWIKEAEDFLRTKRFVFPSVKALRRLILSTRHQSMEQVMLDINSRIGEERRQRLDVLLQTQDELKTSWSRLTDKNIYSATALKLSEVLTRIKYIRELTLKELDFSQLPEQHVRHLAQQGIHLSAWQLKEYAPLRRHSIMAVTLKELEVELTDIVVQMNDEILAGIFQRAEQRSETYLRKHRQLIHRVITAFRWMSEALLDETLPPEKVVERITEKFPTEKLRALQEESDLLNIPRGAESLYFASRASQAIQKYLPALLETFTITSSSKSDPILEALNYYMNRCREGRVSIGQDAPTEFIQERRWKRVVFDPRGKPKTKPWILCLADRLKRSFRQGSLEIEGTRQYRSLNSDLIPWTEWNSIEKKVDERLPFSVCAEAAVNPPCRAIQDLSSSFKKWFDEEEASPFTIDKQNQLHPTKLDRISEPESAGDLRSLLEDKMPSRSLSEILVETDELVGYSEYFTRLSSGQSLRQDARPSGQALYALLLSAACNIPLSKIATSPGLSISLLESVREDTIRPQTLQAATAALVDFHSRLPLAQIWGGGETSSSDGQGFVAAGHPLGALYHPRRFGKKRGFIIYTHISDNYAPFYTQVIPASAREATYVLDGLLYHGSSLIPREHYTDSHGYTDVVFALTYLLGFRLAPRMANVPALTLWYGKGYEVDLPELFDGRISLQSIASQWEAIQKVAATIYSGRTRASQIIRKISSFSRKQSLFKALRNLGRLVRTRHILELASNKDYQRRILQGLNKGESRNALAKDVRYARRGFIRERDLGSQLNVASSMNLVILCTATWNTVHMQRGIRSLLRQGYKVNEEDLRFLSPFVHEHVNLYGQFRFQPVPKLDPLSVEKEFQPLW